MNVSRGALLRALIGIAISVVALALAVRGVDLERTASVVGTAGPAWIGAMLACNLLDIAVRGARWQRLLAPIHRVGYRPMLGYLLIGYLANNVLPARLGELVRSHYLGEREGVSRATTLGTVVVERVIDITVVVLIASGAVVVLQARGLVANAALVGLALAGFLVVALAVLLAAHRLPGADRAMQTANRWPAVGDVARKLRGGLAVAGRSRTVGEAIALSLVAWSFSILAFAAAGQAIGVELTMGQAGLLSAGVALATAIPSGPGYLGTFELAAVELGGTFGLAADPAFAIALIVHAGILVVTSTGGAIALLRFGWLRPTPAVASAQPAEGPVAGR